MPTKPRSIHEAETKASQQAFERYRGSARQRGYTTAWDKVAKAYKQEHPFCVRCEQEDGILNSEDVVVDHIKPTWAAPELVLDPINLQTLCKRHNKLKEAEDASRFRIF